MPSCFPVAVLLSEENDLVPEPRCVSVLLDLLTISGRPDQEAHVLDLITHVRPVTVTAASCKRLDVVCEGGDTRSAASRETAAVSKPDNGPCLLQSGAVGAFSWNPAEQDQYTPTHVQFETGSLLVLRSGD